MCTHEFVLFFLFKYYKTFLCMYFFLICILSIHTIANASLYHYHFYHTQSWTFCACIATVHSLPFANVIFNLYTLRSSDHNMQEYVLTVFFVAYVVLHTFLMMVLSVFSLSYLLLNFSTYHHGNSVRMPDFGLKNKQTSILTTQ